jgi:DNA-binding GntR family transcriptional regulator
MSAVELVHAAVLSELVSGALPPGSRIRQDELADRLGVSKIPVREALQRLAASGLLRFESNRGAVVPVLTAGEAAEVYALRRAIEPVLLARAVPRLTIVDLAAAEHALVAGGPGANWDFHGGLYRAAGWARGVAVAESLHAAVAPYVALYTEVLGGASSSDDQHHALLDACRRRAVREARRVLTAHLDGAATALTAALSAVR